MWHNILRKESRGRQLVRLAETCLNEEWTARMSARRQMSSCREADIRLVARRTVSSLGFRGALPAISEEAEPRPGQSTPLDALQPTLIGKRTVYHTQSFQYYSSGRSLSVPTLRSQQRWSSSKKDDCAAPKPDCNDKSDCCEPDPCADICDYGKKQFSAYGNVHLEAPPPDPKEEAKKKRQKWGCAEDAPPDCIPWPEFEAMKAKVPPKKPPLPDFCYKKEEKVEAKKDEAICQPEDPCEVLSPTECCPKSKGNKCDFGQFPFSAYGHEHFKLPPKDPCTAEPECILGCRKPAPPECIPLENFDGTKTESNKSICELPESPTKIEAPVMAASSDQCDQESPKPPPTQESKQESAACPKAKEKIDCPVEASEPCPPKQPCPVRAPQGRCPKKKPSAAKKKIAPCPPKKVCDDPVNKCGAPPPKDDGCSKRSFGTTAFLAPLLPSSSVHLSTTSVRTLSMKAMKKMPSIPERAVVGSVKRPGRAGWRTGPLAEPTESRPPLAAADALRFRRSNPTRPQKHRTRPSITLKPKPLVASWEERDETPAQAKYNQKLAPDCRIPCNTPPRSRSSEDCNTFSAEGNVFGSENVPRDIQQSKKGMVSNFRTLESEPSDIYPPAIFKINTRSKERKTLRSKETKPFKNEKKPSDQQLTAINRNKQPTSKRVTTNLDITWSSRWDDDGPVMETDSVPTVVFCGGAGPVAAPQVDTTLVAPPVPQPPKPNKNMLPVPLSVETPPRPIEVPQSRVRPKRAEDWVTDVIRRKTGIGGRNPPLPKAAGAKVRMDRAFSCSSGGTKIRTITARQVFDSRGNPTIEVDLCTEHGKFTSMVPSGASTGTHEAVELRDDGKSYHGKSVFNAIKNVTDIIAPALIAKEIPVESQEELDQFMIKLDGTENKSKLGANSILAISMAVCKAAAKAKGIPLCKHIQELNKTPELVMPVPAFNVINGGVHAGNDLAMQEFMIMPTGAKCFSEAMQMGSETYHHLKSLIKKKHGLAFTTVGDEGGFAPNISEGRDVIILIQEAIKKAGYEGKIQVAMDPAASEFFQDGKYNLNFKKGKNDKMLTTEELLKVYKSYVDEFGIISIEDPFDQESWDGHAAITAATKIQIVVDDVTVTNTKRLEKAIAKKAGNAMLLKVNQVGTVTESLYAHQMAFAAQWGTMVSHRSGETEDSFIADLVVGLSTGQIKTGAPCRSERLAKYNQLLRIEEDAGKIRYAGQDFHFPLTSSSGGCAPAQPPATCAAKAAPAGHTLMAETPALAGVSCLSEAKILLKKPKEEKKLVMKAGDPDDSIQEMDERPRPDTSEKPDRQPVPKDKEIIKRKPEKKPAPPLKESPKHETPTTAEPKLPDSQPVKITTEPPAKVEPKIDSHPEKIDPKLLEPPPTRIDHNNTEPVPKIDSKVIDPNQGKFVLTSQIPSPLKSDLNPPLTPNEIKTSTEVTSESKIELTAPINPVGPNDKSSKQLDKTSTTESHGPFLVDLSDLHSIKKQQSGEDKSKNDNRDSPCGVSNLQLNTATSKNEPPPIANLSPSIMKTNLRSSEIGSKIPAEHIINLAPPDVEPNLLKVQPKIIRIDPDLLKKDVPPISVTGVDILEPMNLEPPKKIRFPKLSGDKEVTEVTDGISKTGDNAVQTSISETVVGTKSTDEKKAESTTKFEPLLTNAMTHQLPLDEHLTTLNADNTWREPVKSEPHIEPSAIESMFAAPSLNIVTSSVVNKGSKIQPLAKSAEEGMVNKRNKSEFTMMKDPVTRLQNVNEETSIGETLNWPLSNSTVTTDSGELESIDQVDVTPNSVLLFAGANSRPIISTDTDDAINLMECSHLDFKVADSCKPESSETLVEITQPSQEFSQYPEIYWNKQQETTSSSSVEQPYSNYTESIFMFSESQMPMGLNSELQVKPNKPKPEGSDSVYFIPEQPKISKDLQELKEELEEKAELLHSLASEPEKLKTIVENPDIINSLSELTEKLKQKMSKKPRKKTALDNAIKAEIHSLKQALKSKPEPPVRLIPLPGIKKLQGRDFFIKNNSVCPTTGTSKKPLLKSLIDLRSTNPAKSEADLWKEKQSFLIKELGLTPVKPDKPERLQFSSIIKPTNKITVNTEVDAGMVSEISEKMNVDKKTNDEGKNLNLEREMKMDKIDERKNNTVQPMMSAFTVNPASRKGLIEIEEEDKYKELFRPHIFARGITTVYIDPRSHVNPFMARKNRETCKISGTDQVAKDVADVGFSPTAMNELAVAEAIDASAQTATSAAGESMADLSARMTQNISTAQEDADDLELTNPEEKLQLSADYKKNSEDDISALAQEEFDVEALTAELLTTRRALRDLAVEVLATKFAFETLAAESATRISSAEATELIEEEQDLKGSDSEPLVSAEDNIQVSDLSDKYMTWSPMAESCAYGTALYAKGSEEWVERIAELNSESAADLRSNERDEVVERVVTVESAEPKEKGICTEELRTDSVEVYSAESDSEELDSTQLDSESFKEERIVKSADNFPCEWTNRSRTLEETSLKTVHRGVSLDTILPQMISSGASVSGVRKTLSHVLTTPFPMDTERVNVFTLETCVIRR